MKYCGVLSTPQHLCFNIHDSVDPKLLHKCDLLLTVTNLCMLLAYLNSYIMLVFSTHTLSQSLSVSLP